MNPLLARLQPYPFARLRQLFEGVVPNSRYTPISLGIGEPKHATPEIIQRAYAQALPTGLSNYPPTAGESALRQSCANWLDSRYGVTIDPNTQLLPVLGTREALFSLAQTIIDPSKGDALVACPNPFYQIYEGAALLAGAQLHYVPCDPELNFAPRWDRVPAHVWERVQLLYVCSPGNPTGAVMPLEQWRQVLELSQRYQFVIASDECYSEIYFHDDAPPLGGLQAAKQLGLEHFKGLIMLTSLSKRSNVPGMRSGFVAGDAQLIEPFLLYRTYHGSAMSAAVAQASICAWGDEGHVIENRRMYREKFDCVTTLLQGVLDVRLPDAGFYLWAGVSGRYEGNDTQFARDLYEQYNVTVLPGSFLARSVEGHNPGKGRVRMALVAPTQECLQAAQRIVEFVQRSQS